MNLNRKISGVIALVLLLALSMSAAAESVVAMERTRVYQKASKSAKYVYVSAGTTMEKTAERDGWYRVEKDGNTAYVPVNQVEELKEYGGVKGYAAEKTTLYKSITGEKKICTIPEDAEVKVYSVAGDWAYIKYSGSKGYALLDDLTNKAPAAKEETKKPEAEDEVEESADGVIDMHGMKVYARAGAKAYKSASTSSKLLGTLKQNDTVSLEAVKGDWCMVTNKAGATGYMRMQDLSTTRIEEEEDEKDEIILETPAPEISYAVKEMDWWTSDIQKIFARGVTATITDVETGISWKEVRKGGTNHADVQPVTAEDTAKLKKVYGGSWSWNRRAIWVTIDGQRYAASMNGMPHGSGSIDDNNFDGHHCIHFTNSRTHSGNRLDSQHQAMVKKALAAGR